MKTVIIFIDWFLPGYKAGGPVRSVANLISHLSDKYKFLIITTNTDYLENQAYKNIESNKWNDFDTNVKVFYFSKENLSKPKLKEIIEKTDFDIVYINGIYSYYFSILPLFLIKNKKIIVAARGMLSEQAFCTKNAKKKLFLTIANFIGLYKKIIFQATNKKEKEQIKKRIRKFKRIVTVPNLPKKIQPEKNTKQIKKSGTLKLVSIARISPEKNTLFALKILTDFKFSGKIKFDLYGSVYNPDYWKKCLSVIENSENNITVNYKNSIENKKVYETFAEYHFAFMPSQGENFGHSMLESMSAACPVIISKNTPWQKLEENQIGWDINLNNTKKFSQIIQKCIDMPQNQYDIISNNAFKFAKSFTQNNENIKKMNDLFKNII